MDNTEAGMVVDDAKRLERAMDNAAKAAQGVAYDVAQMVKRMESLSALLTEATQVEGPLSADLRERMADAVGL